MSCCHKAIESLIYRYGYAMDAGDFSGVGALFSRACLTYLPAGMRLKGANEIDRFLTKFIRIDPETGAPRTLHQITNVLVELDESGEYATASSVFMVFQVNAEGPLKTISMGRYADKFVLDAGVWRFAERKVLPEYFGDLSQHIIESGLQGSLSAVSH